MAQTHLRNVKIRARVLPDGFVMLHSPQDNRVYTLTPIGGLVWEYCDGRNSIDDIVTKISEIDEVSFTPDLHSQVVALTDQLTESGLLEVIS